MTKVIEGDFSGTGKKIGIAASRFNDFIVGRLVDGAVGTLVRHGVKDDDITVAWAPGAFELPVVVKKMVESKKYHAVIALGCVIRGATPHFDDAAGEAAKGIGDGGPEQRRAGVVRRAHHGVHRTGDRTCRYEGGQQGRGRRPPWARSK